MELLWLYRRRMHCDPPLYDTSDNLKNGYGFESLGEGNSYGPRVRQMNWLPALAYRLSNKSTLKTQGKNDFTTWQSRSRFVQILKNKWTVNPRGKVQKKMEIYDAVKFAV